MPPLYWQRNYGAFTFGKKRLPHVIAYVERQKEHHREKTLIGALERVEESGQGKISEHSMSYLADYVTWMNEMQMID